MSEIFGLIQKKGTPVQEEVFYHLNSHFPQKAAHIEHSSRLYKEAGFGKLLIYDIPEDQFDQLVVFLQAENILFTAQGRIDNRDELQHLLGIVHPENHADSYFILQAYLRYGEDVLLKLKGDWCFAAYHFDNKQLFIARDTMGYTSLFYYENDNYFIFSSSIKRILAFPSFTKILNEQQFISSLTLWTHPDWQQDNQTIFKSVYYIPIGHYLNHSLEKTTISKYWPPDFVKEIICKRKEDYYEAMMELFNKAVKARLRSFKPVASMLSGGLDSSAVSFVAAFLLAEKKLPLTTFSHVPLFKDLFFNDPVNKLRIPDETSLIKTIVKASGNIESQLLKSEKIGPAKGIVECINAVDGLIHGADNANWLVDIYSSVADQGFGALLTGEGGNGSISFDGFENLLPFSPKRFIHSPSFFVKRHIIRPILQPILQPYRTNKKIVAHLEYINNGFLQQEEIDKLEIVKKISSTQSIHSKQKDLFFVKNKFIEIYAFRSLAGAAFGHHYGISLRDPTCDIDLMNYFLQLPNNAFFNDAFENRNVVKQMMRFKLPDEVLFSRKKGLQSADIFWRVKEDKKDITALLKSIQNNEFIKYLIDVPKLENCFNIILAKEEMPKNQVNLFLKTLYFAIFLNIHFK